MTRSARLFRTLAPATFSMLVFGVAGCDDNEECRALKALVAEREKVHQAAKMRADLHERIKASAEAAEASAKKKLVALGLDQPESQQQKLLYARVDTIPTATVTRGTRMVEFTEPSHSGAAGAPGSPGEPSHGEHSGQSRHASTESVTTWTIQFIERDERTAFAVAQKILQTPPLFRFGTLLHDRPRHEWRFELLRAAVDQATQTPEPEPLPKRGDLAKVKGQFGFCGADDLRKQVADLDEKIAALEPKALGTSVLLPMSATWLGLERRAAHLYDSEQEARRLIQVLVEGALAARVPLKGVGVEGEVVVLEVLGQARERQALLEKLPQQVVEAIREPDTQRKGIIRLIVANRPKSGSGGHERPHGRNY